MSKKRELIFRIAAGLSAAVLGMWVNVGLDAAIRTAAGLIGIGGLAVAIYSSMDLAVKEKSNE